MTKLKRMTRNMYTTREHGTGHVFCFVCCLHLCQQIINAFIHVLLNGANSPLNESDEELRMKEYVVFIFHGSCFVSFKIMQSKQRQFWSYYHLGSRFRSLQHSYKRAVYKIKRILSSTGKRPTT